MPQIGSVVTAKVKKFNAERCLISNTPLKVVRVNPRFASANILCVGPQALKEQFRGIIRYPLHYIVSHFVE